MTDPPQAPLGALRQIQVRFDPEQDRLLLRINTTSAAELRCWLTRRMLVRLWPHLERALATNAPAVSQPTPEARETVKAFQREGAIQRTDFSKSFEEEEQKPLGDEPILVSRVNLRRAGDDHLLHLAPKEGKGLNLRISDPVLHSLCELIRRAVALTDWPSWEVELGQQAAPPEPESSVRH